MQYRVALRKESVDRNVYDDWMKLRRTQSLSARRAWIEIDFVWMYCGRFAQSLSARRAWIEMMV